MERFLVLVRKSITLFTKANLRMIFIMGMDGLSILTEITTLVIGLMENALVMDDLLISLEGFMRVSGSTVNSWENDQLMTY